MAACPNTKRAYFQFRRGDNAYWAANGSTVLREGEPAYNTTNNRLKIGYKNASGQDQTWDQLPYIGGSGSDGDIAPGDIVVTAAVDTSAIPFTGTTVTILPLAGITLAPGQLIKFTDITTAFTTSSVPVENNTVYYIKTLSSQTQFTLSTTASLGEQIIFNPP
jgi:hypothetical protein